MKDLTALNGKAVLSGALLGSGGAGLGGTFKLDIMGAANLDALASSLGAGGINGSIGIHTRTGNLALAAGSTLKANSVTLTADEDDITVDDDDVVATYQIVTADIDDGDSAFEFHYYRKISPLSASLNWLMQDYPDIYLFGSLTEAYGFQKDAENQALWGSRRDEVIEDILKLDTRTRGPSAIMVAGATP